MFTMEIEVEFTEKLERSTCSRLLLEAIKYLIFHRYQTPLPFDHVKAQHERDRKSENARRSPRNRPLPSVLKKKQQLIGDVEELLLNVYRVFLQVDVLEVVLLFGATVVNPKETYTVRFYNIDKVKDTDKIKAACISGKENGFASHSKFVDGCCRKLVRMLFTDPGLSDLGELGCTSIHCFVLAPRNLETSWFRPKASFKIPKKGMSCVIKVYSGDSDGEVRTLGDDGKEEAIGGNDGEVRIFDSNVMRTLDDNDKDTLWFQAPVVIKGFKET